MLKWVLIALAGAAALGYWRIASAADIATQDPAASGVDCPIGEIRKTGLFSFILGSGVHVGRLEGPVKVCTAEGYCIETPKGLACRKY